MNLSRDIRPCPVPIRLFLVPLLLLLAVSSGGTAYADGINGFLEYSGSFSDSTSTTAGQEPSKSKTTNFSQRYGLNLNRTLYPYLRLSTGGIFDSNVSDTKVNGADQESTVTQISPYFNLSLGNPFMPSAIGYNRNETTSSGTGNPSQTTVLETYTASLGLRPEDLPSLDLRFTRTNSFDKDKVNFNTTADYYSLTAQYKPLDNLALSYNGGLFKTTDKVTGLENQTITHTASAAYTEQFFANRVGFFTNGTLSSQEATISSQREGGIVVQPVFPGPVMGLFKITPSSDASPVTVTSGALTDTPQLLNDATALKINIVTPITAPTPLPGTEINMGLRFTERTVVNTLFLTVSSGTNTSNLIGSGIDARFSWNIYTSENGIDWGLNPVQTINGLNAPIGRNPFSAAPNSVGFILALSVPAARFIKVVVEPLRLKGIIQPEPAGIDLNSILVTRMDALKSTTVTANEELKNSTLDGTLVAGVTVKLLNRPSLPTVNYDSNVNFSFNRPNSGETATTLLFTNGLSAYQKFNRYISASARLSREDSDTKEGHLSSNSYNASMNIQPLRTLSHSLTYSGRSQSSGGKTSSSNSFFISNLAELYRGLSFRLSGGLNLNENEDGSNNQSTIVTSGVTINPHRTLNFNISYSESHSESTGGGRVDSSSFTRTGELTTSYAPFSSLSLFATFGFSAQSNRKTITTQSFGGNWSPFRDGAIMVNISYLESINSTGDQKTKILSPSLQWNIRQGWSLFINYSLLTTQQIIADLENELEQSNISMGLRISF